MHRAIKKAFLEFTKEELRKGFSFIEESERAEILRAYFTEEEITVLFGHSDG